MISFRLSTIASILRADWIGEDVCIETVTTDSRTLGATMKRKCLFVALKGDRFDAHDFAKQAISTSFCSALLVNRPIPLTVPQLIVTDTKRALGQLGAWVRRQVSARIVAVTGSSGKTTVKEMTAAILRQCGNVLATQGNFNNEIGVPLTLLRLTPIHDYAVIEIGANRLGEISWITSLVRPEAALINNLFIAHLTGFGSLSAVAKAKGEIFSGLSINGRGIFNADSHDWKNWKKDLDQRNIWRFATQATNNVDFFASHIEENLKGIRFLLHTPSGACAVRLPLLGIHNVSNALAACALSMSVGASLSSVVAGLKKIQPLPGRLFPILLGRNQLLLDDSYNSNVGSMIAAIRVLLKIPGYKVMVVSDMAELGNNTAAYHWNIGKIIAATSGIDKILSIGYFSYLISNASRRGEHFQNKAILIDRILLLLSEKKPTTILIKGSRNAVMEQVVLSIQERVSC
ncbi:UDP-N-acetylmuramoyl-tripeptide--D-alanyl-D-alanine ligase [Sodalis sp. CWE]|uniref:UDP-N-acetylmuramoyl-tripeptide--D-alanyl-D- alanine ligase n=1 Tax=Sodalis sp. CWE TaxID=2803816 RepID=UPI001C7E096D|nr:UDP-N-acetylmuramoyl-tripeptide--D-alanyl-D-alanine ligase [Sodalis sp. CWE]MBX4180713.1 UDP-N-acetylmuramoyl-tripeptide--D-alanyl-D-alanine ligase [Sodalis sp. CWE]